MLFINWITLRKHSYENPKSEQLVSVFTLHLRLSSNWIFSKTFAWKGNDIFSSWPSNIEVKIIDGFCSHHSNQLDLISLLFRCFHSRKDESNRLKRKAVEWPETDFHMLLWILIFNNWSVLTQSAKLILLGKENPCNSLSFIWVCHTHKHLTTIPAGICWLLCDVSRRKNLFKSA